MNLSSDLISQFVKETRDKSKEKTENVVYGTVKIVDGETYAQLDGSELLTPVNATATTKEGDRVTVMIKNHTATVTGNISSPSATHESVKEVGDRVDQFNIILADKITTEQLSAVTGTIDNLKSKLASISKLEAVDAEIESLIAKFADIEYITANDIDAVKATIESLEAKFGTFTDISTEDLNALNGYIQQLSGYNAEFTYVSAEVLKAMKAEIKNLDVGGLTAEEADIRYAKIGDLDATNANITNLGADVADINTLIFGSAAGTTISTQFANAIIAVLANAQIKSAMIDSLSADKITAGSIKTNLVDIVSEDGKMVISDETIQISDDTRVRVQIGKDASNDYSITVWDADGNVMFGHDGITDKAIKDAIIRNDMIAQDANISAEKIDINSLFEVINNDGSHTLKSSKILIDADNQTLDIAFENLTTKTKDNEDEITAQGTKISAIEGQISSKIWQNDIDTAKGEMNTQYSNLSQELGEFKTEVGETYATDDELETARSTLAQEADEFKMEVSQTFAGTSDPEIHNGSAIYLSDISEMEKTAKVTVDGVNLLDVSAYNALGGVTYDSTTGSFTSNVSNSYYCRFRTSALNELFMNNLEKTFVFSANTGITGRFMSIIIGGTRLNGSTYQEVNGTSGSRYVSITVASDFTSINYVEFRWNRANSAFTDTTTVVSELQLEFGNTPTTYADYVDPTSKVSLKRVGSNVANITTPVSGWFLDSNGTGTTADSRFVRLYALAVKPNTTYTLSSNLEIYSVWNATDSGPISQIVTQVNANEVTVTTCENVARLRITLNNTSGAADTTAFEWFMVSHGSEALPYEPYTEKLFEITADGTPNDIPLISPNTAIFTETEGVATTCQREQNPLRSLETSIQVLKDSFKTLVRGQNGKSVMIQDENGWYFSTEDIQSSINSAANAASEASNAAGNVNTSLESFKDEMGELTDRVYIGKTPDTDEACIMIQEVTDNGDGTKTPSAFKICITAQYIGFYEDASKLLWITNKKINADSIVVNEELSIANEHTWKRRQVKSRMHTSLTFVGSKNLMYDGDVEKSSSAYTVGYYKPKEPLVAGEKYNIEICWTPAQGCTALKFYFSQGNKYIKEISSGGTYNQRITKTTFTCSYTSSGTPANNIANSYLYLYRDPNSSAVTGTTTIHWIRVTKGGS